MKKYIAFAFALISFFIADAQRINGGLGIQGPTGPTGPAGSSASANNGCTLYGDSVGLGGALNSETTIDANGNFLVIGDTATNTGIAFEPNFLALTADSQVGLGASSIELLGANNITAETKKVSIISDDYVNITTDSTFIMSTNINFSNTDNLYAQTNTDTGFNTSLFLSPIGTSYSLNQDTMAAGVSNIRNVDGTGFFTNMYVGKNDFSASPGDIMRLGCAYNYTEALAHVEAAYIERNFTNRNTLNHISAYQSGLYMAFDSENSDDLGATGFAYLIDSTYRARWLWRGQEIASIDTNGYVISANTLTASATLDFGTIGAHGSETLTISCTGAVLGDVVSLGIPNASMESDASFVAWVSAADTVSVKCFNFNGSSFDPASGTFTVKIIK